MNITHSLGFVACVFFSAIAFGDNSDQSEADVWRRLRPFVGKWQGETDGEPGTGKSERNYAFTLRERFIQITNKSVYPPQDKNPNGEIHEDIGFFSYDRRAKKFMLRQFHVEGFVNQFVEESFDANERTLVFVSTAIENIAPGWRARETYRFLNDEEFIETFAVAEPGRDFTTYSETHFRRKPSE
jgi:hypothetical protein